MGPCPLPTYGGAAQHHTEWAHRGERRHGSSVSLRLQLYLAATGPAPTSLSGGVPFTNPPWQVASHKLPNVTLWGRLLNAKYVEGGTLPPGRSKTTPPVLGKLQSGNVSTRERLPRTRALPGPSRIVRARDIAAVTAEISDIFTLSSSWFRRLLSRRTSALGPAPCRLHRLLCSEAKQTLSRVKAYQQSPQRRRAEGASATSAARLGI